MTDPPGPSWGRAQGLLLAGRNVTSSLSHATDTCTETAPSGPPGPTDSVATSPGTWGDVATLCVSGPGGTGPRQGPGCETRCVLQRLVEPVVRGVRPYLTFKGLDRRVLVDSEQFDLAHPRELPELGDSHLARHHGVVSGARR